MPSTAPSGERPALIPPEGIFAVADFCEVLWMQGEATGKAARGSILTYVTE